MVKILFGLSVAIATPFDKKNKIELTAELFSVDGKRRFFLSDNENIENHIVLAKRIAEDLKKQSKGSYKG